MDILHLMRLAALNNSENAAITVGEKWGISGNGGRRSKYVRFRV